MTEQFQKQSRKQQSAFEKAPCLIEFCTQELARAPGGNRRLAAGKVIYRWGFLHQLPLSTATRELSCLVYRGKHGASYLYCHEATKWQETDVISKGNEERCVCCSAMAGFES